MGLGAASVKAQVRIGGNAAPNASAVLDLNADGTNSGTKGLALPRVALTSNTMLLSGVTANLTGMMVYNTSTTGAGVGAMGFYYWNGATWVQASLPSTSAADSGLFLMSTGSGWVKTAIPNTMPATMSDHTLNIRAMGSVTWTKVLDTAVTVTLSAGGGTFIPAPGVGSNDFCLWASYQNYRVYPYHGSIVGINIVNPSQQVQISNAVIRCYRPSI